VNPIKKSIPYGRHTLTLETGEIARQAGGAVLASLDDTVVLVTVVARQDAKDLRMRLLPYLNLVVHGHIHEEQLGWLHRSAEAHSAMFTDIVRSLYPGFVERYADRLSPDVVTLSDRVVTSLEELNADRPRPWTVAHSDFRLDNLLFQPGSPHDPVVVVDWQTCGYGPGISDLSYFIGGSLQTDDRRSSEGDLVRDYHERMQAAGVAIAWDDLWAQYRRYTVAGLIMAIAASMLVKRTERGDEMFLVMAERAGRHALDLDALVRTSSP